LHELLCNAFHCLAFFWGTIIMTMQNSLKDYLKAYIAGFRAAHLWFHGAHNVARGTGFAGDHVLLYGEIYQAFQNDIDAIIEKAIGLTEDESMACPISITEGAITIMREYATPSSLDALGIAAMGERLISDFLGFSTDMFHILEDSDELSLGLNDFIMAHANKYETYVYLLRQRIKTNLDN
jgi:DNA-binding ferritin-like protein